MADVFNTMRPRNLFHALECASARARDLRAHAEGLVTRLAGLGNDSEGNPPIPYPPGLLGKGLEQVDDLVDALDRIGAALSRLESALPEQVVGAPTHAPKVYGSSRIGQPYQSALNSSP